MTEHIKQVPSRLRQKEQSSVSSQREPPVRPSNLPPEENTGISSHILAYPDDIKPVQVVHVTEKKYCQYWE